MRLKYTDLSFDHPHRRAINVARRSTDIAGHQCRAVGEEYAVGIARRRGVIYEPETPCLEALEAITDPSRRAVFQRDNSLELQYERRARLAYSNLFASGWADRDDAAENAKRLEQVHAEQRQRQIEQRAAELAAEAAARDAAKFRARAEKELSDG
jgi:hypothetical protein